MWEARADWPVWHQARLSGVEILTSLTVLSAEAGAIRACIKELVLTYASDLRDATLELLA
jgi:hypothetical protein